MINVTFYPDVVWIKSKIGGKVRTSRAKAETAIAAMQRFTGEMVSRNYINDRNGITKANQSA